MRTKFYNENIRRMREETEGLFNRIILQVIIGPERNLVNKANPEFGGGPASRATGGLAGGLSRKE
jgi:hypothetical protein